MNDLSGGGSWVERGKKKDQPKKEGTGQWAGGQQYQLSGMGMGESSVLFFIQHVPQSEVWECGWRLLRQC